MYFSPSFSSRWQVSLERDVEKHDYHVAKHVGHTMFFVTLTLPYNWYFAGIACHASRMRWTDWPKVCCIEGEKRGRKKGQKATEWEERKRKVCRSVSPVWKGRQRKLYRGRWGNLAPWSINSNCIRHESKCFKVTATSFGVPIATAAFLIYSCTVIRLVLSCL
jgi:hypothetical protein